MNRKYFTLEQANRALPLVKRIVADITQEYAKWREQVQQYELVAAGSRGDGPESPEQVTLRRGIDDSARHINGYVEELTQIGCVFKGFEEGLVDFYCQKDDRDIFLCWKHGEPEVSHWHELDAGFAGRQPIEELETVKGEP